ncbi:MAG: PAS domain-containing protein [Anaerolineae bacterium]|nr:PAS domain-containing protein [Anaerolineae bacterium]
MNSQSPRYVSLRWRVLLPLFIVLLLVLMTGAYLIFSRLPADMSSASANLLAQGSRDILRQAQQFVEVERELAQQIATNGTETAQDLGLLAQGGDADVVALVDSQGIERLTLYRAGEQFQQRAGTNLGLVGEETISGILEINGVGMLYTATPAFVNGNNFTGYGLAGHRLERVLQPTSAVVDLAFYTNDGRRLYSTLPQNVTWDSSASTVALEGQEYALTRVPFEVGGHVQGVLDVLVEADAGGNMLPQLIGLLLAALTAVVIIAVFVILGRMLARLDKVRSTSEALAAGQMMMRTGLQPTDEIGTIGHALDTFATYMQEHQDLLRRDLRRQRREVAHLLAVLESIPDGVIVLDMDGHVTVVNRLACELLGSQQAFAEDDAKSLTAFVTDALGPALAPGIYALGSPHELEVNERTLSAQAAAVMTPAAQRVGTVIVLRDITQEVWRERTRERLLAQLQQDIQPLERPQEDPMRDFAREMRSQAVALQKLVLELRGLNNANLTDVPDSEPRAIMLDTLVWSLANEWRQVAQANNHTLHVMIEQPGLMVFGNERRLRWAIGNLIDNAIKYTPPGGDVTLEIREDTSDNLARLRIRDNGVGISNDDMPNIFTRFYRGKPVTSEGRLLDMPGAGQGLNTAQQIIESIGGTLVLRSKQWVGTAIYISLPLANAPQPELVTENLANFGEE